MRDNGVCICISTKNLGGQNRHFVIVVSTRIHIGNYRGGLRSFDEREPINSFNNQLFQPVFHQVID